MTPSVIKSAVNNSAAENSAVANLTNTNAGRHKVLLLTGGFLTEKETSLIQAIRKQSLQKKHSKNAWLDLKLKVLTIEPIICMTLEKLFGNFYKRISADLKSRLFQTAENNYPPELTEVVLATHLLKYNMPFEATTIAELFSDTKKTGKLLTECDCVFLSSTFLRDLSELEPVIRLIRRKHNHIVLGGALTGLVHEQWQGMAGVEVLAIGYGEFLIPALVEWIRSDYKVLNAPVNGSLYSRNNTRFLHGGLADDFTLDMLPKVDWKIPASYHQKKYSMIYYESVRGCPYSCSFCNYPYLFDDNKFRYFSASRIADDWEYYTKELGIEYISCLDSLFTMPKRRLIELCNTLITRNINVKWICYARADDLADVEIVILMKRAGAHQVQIGLESGDPDILNNMNKRCSVSANAKAINNCRKHGLTTVVSVIVGFPGESAKTLEATYQFMQENPPDFYYLAVFSTRATKVPVLNETNRQRFKIISSDSEYTMAPYWQHSTMNCLQASDHVRHLNQRLMLNKVSMNAVLFYAGIINYLPQDRQTLLQFQQRIVSRHGLIRGVFSWINQWINRRMKEDIQSCFTDKPEITVFVEKLTK